MRSRFMITVDVLVIATFCCAIWVPLMGNIFGLDQVSSYTENRNLTPRPETPHDLKSLARYPKKFEAYYNDHFGFRSDLIYLYNYFQLICFSNSNNGSVLVGKDGWLYYKKPRVTNYYRSDRLFKPKDLRRWQQVLMERKKWLEARGIEFVVIFAPHKYTVYPDYLPDFIRKVGDRTRLDELMHHLRIHTDLRVIDLRPALLEARKEHRVFHKTDSHWNTRGAWFAYQAIMQNLSQLFPVLRPCRDDMVEWSTRKSEGRDLAKMLGVQDLFEEEVPKMKFRVKMTHRELDPEDYPASVIDKQRIHTTRKEGKKLPTVVIFRDSFFTELVKFIEPHFRRSVICYDYRIDSAIIEQEKPDLVIFQIVERELMVFDPDMLLDF